MLFLDRLKGIGYLGDNMAVRTEVFVEDLLLRIDEGV